MSGVAGGLIIGRLLLVPIYAAAGVVQVTGKAAKITGRAVYNEISDAREIRALGMNDRLKNVKQSMNNIIQNEWELNRVTSERMKEQMNTQYESFKSQIDHIAVCEHNRFKIGRASCRERV